MIPSHIRLTSSRVVFGLLMLVSVMVCGTSRADEYGDVNQLARSGKFGEALAKADTFLSTKPRDPQMRFVKAVIQGDSGNVEGAIATLTKLIEDYPELPEPYNNLAVLQATMGQYDKARAALEMAVRNNPGYATAQENLGDVYARLAMQAYAKVQQLDPANKTAGTKLTGIRSLLGTPKQGRADNSKAALNAGSKAPTTPSAVPANLPAKAASGSAGSP